MNIFEHLHICEYCRGMKPCCWFYSLITFQPGLQCSSVTLPVLQVIKIKTKGKVNTPCVASSASQFSQNQQTRLEGLLSCIAIETSCWFCLHKKSLSSGGEEGESSFLTSPTERKSSSGLAAEWTITLNKQK